MKICLSFSLLKDNGSQGSNEALQHLRTSKSTRVLGADASMFLFCFNDVTITNNQNKSVY